MAIWATQNPKWPETCAAVPKDVEDWTDEWGYDCAMWAEDCNVAKMNTEADCVSPHNHAEQIVGADGQACEVRFNFGPLEPLQKGLPVPLPLPLLPFRRSRSCTYVGGRLWPRRRPQLLLRRHHGRDS